MLRKDKLLKKKDVRNSKDQENSIESAKETEKVKQTEMTTTNQQSSEAPGVVTPSQLGLSPVSQLKANQILFNDSTEQGYDAELGAVMITGIEE